MATKEVGLKVEVHQPLPALRPQEMAFQWPPPMGLGKLGLQSSVLLKPRYLGSRAGPDLA